MATTPVLILFGLWLLLGLFAILLIFSGVKCFWHRKPVGGCFRLCCALAIGGGAATLGALGLALQTYDRLTHEQAAVVLAFQQTDAQRYTAELRFPEGATLSLELMGDEWQLDARVLRWKGPAIVAGMDSLFRIERLSGRYAAIDRERDGPRSVHALHPEPRTLDPWVLVNRYPDRVPWVDAIYGSATYLPMADGAEYEVVVTQTGLAARPLNEPARRAVRNW
ncbi:cation/multidrug efflux pump [Gammaproteobacteria bacterium AB-CW1]|uniref:Cation/multidrug efflux pump n=1 Tax=Natronospira elongata TaxID=3110268 RepID=A0AAP6ML05_9GAMM|nr:cation/multidrug efflux pump [Gammaproteobacteria bacterium AB-CW1]